MYSYTAIVDYYDKNRAQRLVRKTVTAKNMKDAEKKLNNLGKIIKLSWEDVPDIAADRQLEMFGR
ncbi:MAG: hypothetical protein JM58_00680 [Peptococcaceae bacterium BICA1-8]|nr:MAG: hypothetical protein JM58_00680 [Peptococcaceae bacterium BICA1-8]